MIVVVFQRGRVDHLLEMNETDGTVENRSFSYSLIDLYTLEYRGIILGTDTSSIVLDKITINQFSEQTCSDGDHHNIIICYLVCIHSNSRRCFYSNSTPYCNVTYTYSSTL